MAIYFVTNLWESSIMDDYLEIYNVQLYACSVIKRDLSYCPLCSNCKDNNMNYHFANSEAKFIDGSTISKISNLFKSYASKVVKDMFYNGNFNFLFSHFHQNQTNFIVNIIGGFYGPIDVLLANLSSH